MPFKSKAQRRKFAELLVNGEISEEAGDASLECGRQHDRPRLTIGPPPVRVSS
jgi:hypothetical protein